MSSVLKVENLSVSFGGVHAVSEVSLEVGAGQLVGLIGPNGAGKTTFIDAVTGFVGCRGRIALGDREITRLPPHARSRLGLARTWQSIELFDDLSVRENLAVAARRQSWFGTLKEMLTVPSESEPAAEAALARLGIEALADASPPDLAQGQRKLVSVAQALAASPRLILLDEPAAGLDTEESQTLGLRLREVVDDGLPMLLVDHDMGLVLGICDYVVVIEFGKVIAAGTPAEVRSDPRVVTAYLGAGASELAAEVR